VKYWELWGVTMKPFKAYPGDVKGLKVSNANSHHFDEDPDPKKT
jgi:hypothetical protein